MNTSNPLFAGLVGAVLCIAPAMGSAHSMQYSESRSDSFTNIAGMISFELTNVYDRTVDFEVLVFDKDMQPIDDTLWRSNWFGDAVVLKADESITLRVQFKKAGNYHVCSRATGLGTETQVCARATSRTSRRDLP